MIGDVAYKVESVNIADPTIIFVSIVDKDKKIEIKGEECKIGRLQDNDLSITQADNIADHHGIFKLKKDEGYEYHDMAREGQ